MKRGGWVLKTIVPIMALSLVCINASAESLPADPTKPAFKTVLNDVSDQPQQFVVSSLITGKKQNLAVINGQRVREGDLVQGAKVIAISRKGVRLEVLGEQQFISLTNRQGFSKTKSVK